MFRMVPLCLLVLSFFTQAEIYKTVDENGNVIFTDNPHGEKVEEVELPPVNTQPRYTSGKPKKSKKFTYKAPTKYDISITSPADQTQVLSGQRDLTVIARIAPKLFPGHKIQVLLNGTPFGPSSTKAQITLKEIYRGAHQIQAAVVNDKGKVISRSNAVTVYVRRATVAN